MQRLGRQGFLQLFDLFFDARPYFHRVGIALLENSEADGRPYWESADGNSARFVSRPSEWV